MSLFSEYSTGFLKHFIRLGLYERQQEILESEKLLETKSQFEDERVVPLYLLLHTSAPSCTSRELDIEHGIECTTVPIPKNYDKPDNLKRDVSCTVLS
jgi:hypothetical protein